MWPYGFSRAVFMSQSESGPIRPTMIHKYLDWLIKAITLISNTYISFLPKFLEKRCFRSKLWFDQIGHGFNRLAVPEICGYDTQIGQIQLIANLEFSCNFYQKPRSGGKVEIQALRDHLLNYPKTMLNMFSRSTIQIRYLFCSFISQYHWLLCNIGLFGSSTEKISQNRL